MRSRATITTSLESKVTERRDQMKRSRERKDLGTQGQGKSPAWGVCKGTEGPHLGYFLSDQHSKWDRLI